jgi:hypothetical protein
MEITRIGPVSILVITPTDPEKLEAKKNLWYRFFDAVK